MFTAQLSQVHLFIGGRTAHSVMISVTSPLILFLFIGGGVTGTALTERALTNLIEPVWVKAGNKGNVLITNTFPKFAGADLEGWKHCMKQLRVAP